MARTSGPIITPPGLQETWVPAASCNPRITNGPARGYVQNTTNLQILDTLDFDQTTQQFASFCIKLPKRWDLGTITFAPRWTFSTSSGGVVFALQGVATSNDDPTDVAYGTEQTSTDTALTALDDHQGPTSAAITLAGSPAADDLIWLQIKRNVADGSDTLAAIARLIGIQLYWTSAAGTDA